MNSQSKTIHNTKSGTPGADSVKAKAAISWVSAASGVFELAAFRGPAVLSHGKVVEINLCAMLLTQTYPERFKQQYVEYLAGLNIGARP